MSKIDLNEIKKNSIIIEEPDFSEIDGAYLRRFRMQFKISQALLADYLGVSKKAIEKWEQGKNKMNPVIARLIYLMEQDTKIFSLLKKVRIDDQIFEFKNKYVFNPVEIKNDNSVKNVQIDYKVNWNCENKWKYKDKYVGGDSYVPSGI